MRKPVAVSARNKARDHAWKPPIKGWVSSTPLASPEPQSAVRLENWFPQRRSIRLRGGAARKATVSLTDAVESLFVYENGAVNKMFAATETDIFDISSPATPTTIPAADVSGQTSGRYSTALFSTAGGTFLTAVNGTDDPQQYDGSTWSVPVITGVTSSSLSHVWAYRNRMFFVERDSLNAWYLPADSIAGAANAVSLAGVFQRGGSLLTGTTWSIEAGDGLNDRCVFISTNGEVAVYQGVDPSSPSTWSLVGRYDIARLMGKIAFLRVAGDVLLVTAEGIAPLSAAISRDTAAISMSSISANIEPDWKAETSDRQDHWSAVKWPEKNMMLTALPSTPGSGQYCFVTNTETGAWAKFTGWDTNCVCVYQGFVFFGTSSGTILQAEVGGNDDGENYTCVYVGHADPIKLEGVHKVAQMMRSTFTSSQPFTPRISVVANYNSIIPSPPSAASDAVTSDWDSGTWDVAVWDASGYTALETRWRSVSGQGFVLAPVVQVTCGGVNLPDAQLITNHFRFTAGEVVV